MAFIVESTTFPGDRRLQLGAEDFFRTLSFGTNWTKIRIGVRMSMNDAYGNVLANLSVGVSQGSAACLNSPSIIDAIGLTHGGNIGEYSNNFTRSLNTTPCYRPGVSSAAFNKKGAINTITAGGGYTLNLSGAPAIAQTPWLVDIAKGTPSYTITVWTLGAVTISNVTRATYLLQLENESTPVNMSSSATTMTYSGSALFDTVFIHWSKSTPTVELSDVSVVRFA
jgi:hypothetical protein